MSLKTKLRGLREIWQFDNRLWLAMNRVFFPGENLNIYRTKGIEFISDHAGGDANGAREILTSPMYQRFLPKMKLANAVNILDLGASNGGFPLLLHANGLSLKKVVSLELNPSTFIRLQFNLQRNLTCDIVALNAAVCGETQVLSVALGKGSVSDNIYAENIGDHAEVRQIPGFSFDNIFDSYFADEIVDICKMDVEGAEFDILSSPQHQRLARCRYLILEIHERPEQKASDILPILKDLGFVQQPQEPGSDTSVYFFINDKLVS